MGMRVTERDTRFLKFIDRAGLCTGSMLARRFKIHRKKAYKRLAALKGAGLLEVQEVPMSPLKIYSTTVEGGEVCGLGLASGKVPRLGSWHGLHLTDLMIDFELQLADTGARIITEREIRQADWEDWTVPVGTQSGAHRPDLVVVGESGSANGIELELSPKNAPRLDAILAGFREDPRFTKLIYVCGSASIEQKVGRSAQRTGQPVTVLPWVHPNDRDDRSLFDVWDQDFGGGYVAS